MKKLIATVVFLLFILITGYVYWFYYNAYSDGYRDGMLRKFSRKGNILKTFEGEMVLAGFSARNGSALNADYFYFSVSDHQTADSLQKCLGKVVRLHYVQYRRSLPWRGEDYGSRNAEKGQYVVDNIADVKDAVLY